MADKAFWPFRFRALGSYNGSGNESWLASPRHTGSREKRGNRCHPFALDHFPEKIRDAHDDAIEQLSSLLCRGEAGFEVGLASRHFPADVLRKSREGDCGFKFLGVPGQVVREAMAAF